MDSIVVPVVGCEILVDGFWFNVVEVDVKDGYCFAVDQDGLETEFAFEIICEMREF